MREEDCIRLRPVGTIHTPFSRQSGTPIQPVFAEGAKGMVADLDILDGSPLLDIKPYVPAFDSFPGAKAGWFDARRVDRTHADKRFESRGAE